MSSLRSLMKPIALGGLVASLALLAGCGKSDGGGGSSPTTSYTGSGGETLGTWVLVVTNATGFYLDKHLAPKGLSVAVQIQQTGHNLRLSEDLSDGGAPFTLYADKVNHNYQGAVNYYDNNSDPLYNNNIYESWTLTPTSDGIAVHVTARADDNNSGLANGTGTVDAVLKPVVSYANSLNADWYSVSSKSDEPLRNGEGGVYEEYDWGPGTYVYYYWDGASLWDDYLYIDEMYKDGNVLKGGGWYDGSFADDYKSTFGTIQVVLDANGHPTASSASLTQGYGSNATTATISHPHYDNSETLAARYDTSGTSRDFKIDTVTPGGLLEQYVGAAGTTLSGTVAMNATDFRLSVPTIGYLWAGKITATQATWTVCNPAAYLFYAPSMSYANYDLDGEFGTIERDIITVNFDATSHLPTGGTWKLEIYSPSLTLQSTETMTFTIP